MQIAGLPPALQQGLIAALGRAGEAFAVTAAAGETARDAAAILPAVTPPATQPATSVQMLVALAAQEPATERRRRQAAEADRGLSMLERLHAELVAGTPAPERLQELADWSATLAMPEEPALASLAREIDVRVRVELAKHDINV